MVELLNADWVLDEVRKLAEGWKVCVARSRQDAEEMCGIVTRCRLLNEKGVRGARELLDHSKELILGVALEQWSDFRIMLRYWELAKAKETVWTKECERILEVCNSYLSGIDVDQEFEDVAEPGELENMKDKLEEFMVNVGVINEGALEALGDRVLEMQHDMPSDDDGEWRQFGSGGASMEFASDAVLDALFGSLR